MATTRTKKDPRIAFMTRALDTSSRAYKLAGLLCWKYGNKDGAIFPSQETLAGDLGVKTRTVRTLLHDELVPIGLRIQIRRGPRIGQKMSYYSFGDPDQMPAPRGLNPAGNSGSQGPKSDANFGPVAHQFRPPGDNNSGSRGPCNQKIDPKEGTKRESAARSAHSQGPEEFQNCEAKEGEVIPPPKAARPERQTALPQDWQPSDEGWDYASRECGLTGEDINSEVTNFRDWCAENRKRSHDWSATWRRFVGNSRQNRRNRRHTLADAALAAELAIEAEAKERAAGIDTAPQFDPNEPVWVSKVNDVSLWKALCTVQGRDISDLGKSGRYFRRSEVEEATASRRCPTPLARR